MGTQNFSGGQPVGYIRPPFGLLILAAVIILNGINMLASGIYLWVLSSMVSFSGAAFVSVSLGLLLILAGAGSFLLGYGLYKGRDWARYSVMAYGSILVVLGLIFLGMSTAYSMYAFFSLPMIILGAVAVVYMNLPHVVNYFNFVKQVKARGGTLSYPGGAPPVQPGYPSPIRTPPSPSHRSPIPGPPPSPAWSSSPTAQTIPSRGSQPSPPTQGTIAGVSGPSYTLVLPDGKTIRVINETVKVFGREDFISYLPPNLLNVITRKSKGGHFRITVSYDPNTGKYKYLIEDLNSTNGTFVNGVNISGQGPVELHHGDLISIGNSINMEFKML